MLIRAHQPQTPRFLFTREHRQLSPSAILIALRALLHLRQAAVEPDYTHSNPITHRIRRASGFLQTALSKLPRDKSRADPRVIAGAALIGSYRFSGLIVSGCEPKLIQTLACIWKRGASYRHVKASIQTFEQSLAARASAFVTAQQPGESSLPEIFRAEIVQ
jgi:hypothetical protein